MKKSKKVVTALIAMAVVFVGVSFGAIIQAKAQQMEFEQWEEDSTEKLEIISEQEEIGADDDKPEEDISKMESLIEQNTETESVPGTETSIEESETETESETEVESETDTEEMPNDLVGIDEDSILEDEDTEDIYQYDKGYIFMGDSRIYLMNQDCNIEGPENFFAVCCPGIGYDWMIETGLPQIKNIQKRHPEIENWVVISALGINDMQNANKYIATYKKLAKTVDLWLVSINPTVGRKEPTYSNVCIDAFNKKIRRVSGITYVNTHDYLTKKGFDTKDGLHYTRASNWDIYSYLLNSLLVGRDCEPASDSEAKGLAESLEETLSMKNY